MKNVFSTAVLLISLLGSASAHAVAPVIDAGNIVQTTLTAVKSGLTALSTVAIEAKMAVMEAWDKSVWIQQLKGMWDSLQKLQQQFEELVGLRDDLMNTFSGARDLGGWVPTTSTADANNVDYSFLPKFSFSIFFYLF